MLEIHVNDGKILNVVRQDILWKKFVFENIPESSWSLDGLKDQRTLKLGKVAVQVRLGDAVVIQENVVPHHRSRLDLVIGLIKRISIHRS